VIFAREYLRVDSASDATPRAADALVNSDMLPRLSAAVGIVLRRSVPPE